MKRVLYVIVVFLIFSCGAEPSETELAIRIQQFNEAYEAGNSALLRTMITENYVHTNNAWKSFGRETWLEYMDRRAQKIEDGSLRIESYALEEIDIQISENSAIVTGMITSTGIEDTKAFSKKFRVTNVWIYQNGQWLRAGFHDSPIE